MVKGMIISKFTKNARAIKPALKIGAEGGVQVVYGFTDNLPSIQKTEARRFWRWKLGPGAPGRLNQASEKSNI